MLVECVLDIFHQFKHNPTAHKYTYFAIISQCLLSPMNPRGGGGGSPHVKGVGMLVRNFELNP